MYKALIKRIIIDKKTQKRYDLKIGENIDIPDELGKSLVNLKYVESIKENNKKDAWSNKE